MITVPFFFLAFLTASAYATASVTVLLSLNNQLPQVARIGQPYSWTFLPFTFNSTDGPLTYTTSALPAWLSFDNTSQTFSGIPMEIDKGYPEITVTAHAADTSTSSKFTICVTSASAPTLNRSILDQFNANGSALSSVFALRPNSAIATENPSLRIPGKWSFSVGLEANTFLDASGGNVFYELRLANGSAIPDYMSFNSKTVTLDGVIPSADKFSQPLLVPLSLHASDQEGYTSTVVPFDIILADHELSQASQSLPTINITTATPFVVSLLSAADFTGFLVDDGPLQPSNISLLDIDVSSYKSWLHYDMPSRTLSGTPDDDVTGTSPLLPVILTTIFNQSICTNVSLALVESYFVVQALPSLHLSKGDEIQTSLSQWLTKSSSRPGFDGTNVTASYEPMVAGHWLQFDEYSTVLTGTVPPDFQSDSDHVTVTFTAYSHITHSTSHTTQAIYIANTGNNQSLAPTHPSDLAVRAHKRLVLAVVLTCGLIGGLCLLAGVLAIMRRWARVSDTAVLGEEGRHAWSEKDRRWYGMTLSPHGTTIIEKPRGAYTSPIKPHGPQADYGPLGLGLRRVSERSQQEMGSQEELLSPGVMSKREFLSRIKNTMRKVSEKYAWKQHAAHHRPAIGKPILVSSTRNTNPIDPMVHYSSSNPFDDSMVLSRPGSTFMTGSPSTSTAERSIPRRRPDFAPPKNLAQVHFENGLLVRQPSTGSMGANSFVSGKSGLSGESALETMGPPTKPRLVPFTSSTRVPVPQAVAVPNLQGQENGFAGNRIASQRVQVYKVDSKDDNAIVEDGGIKPSASDEMTIGMHYVRSLGADQLAVSSGGGGGDRSSPAPSNVRSSFTSLESSHVGHRSGSGADVMKVLVRTGERFKFRVGIPSSTTGNSSRATKGYYVKLASGQPLPKFIHADLGGIATKGVVELSGVATFREIGESSIGVYAEKDGACVVSVVIEVVGKR